ncbi:AbrB/MazE/SpoVT family DNA-binding domain-containing protein [Priestia megaterium]|jgi:transcriptional pleiotropic regulator of transition state genes|uniref:AbrB/MazE/SpoVT family DNA-binding domain-containing protein n=1 Tax=Priestia megaterium TaxID=1404 RepID=UPI002A6A1274|nr:AbrB/MazE/SpoVT family DNA-binding domain-containing protein [Priestia megaterium]MDY0943893.1 AbrB/MazE/SpoVT family DNA-binding domain-containing protein [Priestia megaterium]
MKSTGIVRKVDPLGRVVLPSELRKVLDIENKTPIEIYVDGNKIVLQKYQVSQECTITGEIKKENKRYAGNLMLSPEGAEMLLQELRRKTGPLISNS